MNNVIKSGKLIKEVFINCEISIRYIEYKNSYYELIFNQISLLVESINLIHKNDIPPN